MKYTFKNNYRIIYGISNMRSIFYFFCQNHGKTLTYKFVNDFHFHRYFNNNKYIIIILFLLHLPEKNDFKMDGA